MLRPRDTVRTLPIYHPPLAGREGLRLDFNENTSGCSPRVIDRLRQLNAEQLARYPERGPVEARVADFFGRAPEEVLLTNGVDEAIHLLCESYIDVGDESLIVEPTYSMYRIYALGTGANVVNAVPGEDFQFSVESMISRISERTRFIAIANPNNPTGTVASRAQLLHIAHAAPHAAILVDEAYFEFYGETMLDVCAKLTNLFVARTFSKAYGMAGLRVGVLAGNAEQMEFVRRMASPYNVNAIALACLPDAISDQDYITHYVEELLESRGRLEDFLVANEIKFWQSQANFVLMRVGTSADESARFVERMRDRGILVRDRSRDHECEGCVRITLGRREQCDRLLAALQETLEELGLARGVSRI